MNENKLIPYEDKDDLESFLKQPFSNIAAAITGAMSLSRTDAVFTVGRIVQSALKGKLFEQLGNELSQLIQIGKIPADYADKRYGFKSLSDMLEFIDSEVPDEDRFRAVKALFYAVNANCEDVKDVITRYSIFRLARKLESSHWLVLRAAYELDKSVGNPRELLDGGVITWLRVVSEKVGHGIPELLENDEQLLMEFRLITPRSASNKHGVNSDNFRLSDLGLKMCELIEEYNFKTEDSNPRM